MNLKLIGPRIVVRPDAMPELSDGGIALLGGTSTLRGEVVAVGNGPSFVREHVRRALRAVKEKLKGLRAADAVDDVGEGLKYDHIVQVGERVIFSPSSGQELIFEQERLFVMEEDDVMAVIDAE